MTLREEDCFVTGEMWSRIHDRKRRYGYLSQLEHPFDVMLLQDFAVLDVCCKSLLDLFLQISDQRPALLLMFNTVLQVNSATESGKCEENYALILMKTLQHKNAISSTDTLWAVEGSRGTCQTRFCSKVQKREIQIQRNVDLPVKLW